MIELEAPSGEGQAGRERLNPKEATAELFARVHAEGVRPWSWVELPEDEAAALMRLLIGFVEDFNLRYAWSPDQLVPACWPAHGALVEELTVLWWTRYCAFDAPNAKVTDAANWHEKWLPGFLKRLPTWLKGTEEKCRTGQHDRAEQWPAQSQAAVNHSDKMRALTEAMATTELAADRAAAPRCPDVGSPSTEDSAGNGSAYRRDDNEEEDDDE